MKKCRKKRKSGSKISNKRPTGFLNRPFDALKSIGMVRDDVASLEKGGGSGAQSKKERLNEKIEEITEDDRLFIEAMEGVEPLKSSVSELYEKSEDIFDVEGVKSSEAGVDVESDVNLEMMIEAGFRLPVSLTSEYVESRGSRHDVLLARKLHQGQYSVKAYCELHGYDSMSALEECELFMQNALAKGLSCVAFIHGRGLSSKGEPVLKRLVVNWLNNGPFRHFVRAYASAPAWDGGAGVTYVMLSRRKKWKR